MKRKNKDPREHILELCDNLQSEVRRWKDIRQNGCSDPFWPDGVNLNLVRNHIIYEKSQIAVLCDEYQLMLPLEYYTPVPPRVPDNFMAIRKMTPRFQRVSQWHKITFHAPRYKEEQLSFF